MRWPRISGVGVLLLVINAGLVVAFAYYVAKAPDAPVEAEGPAGTASFDIALRDARDSGIDEVSRELVALTQDDPSLFWDQSTGAPKVLAATWTSYSGYERNLSRACSLEVEVWVTPVPQVQDRCRRFGLAGPLPPGQHSPTAWSNTWDLHPVADGQRSLKCGSIRRICFVRVRIPRLTIGIAGSDCPISRRTRVRPHSSTRAGSKSSSSVTMKLTHCPGVDSVTLWTGGVPTPGLAPANTLSGRDPLSGSNRPHPPTNTAGRGTQ